MRDSAAAAAKRISRTQYDRITDRLGKFNTLRYRMHDLGGRYRLSDLFHRILEFLTVLCFFDRLSGRTDQAHIVLL